MSPVIGIIPGHSTDHLGHGTFDRVTLSRNYVDAVIEAGGVPILLPPQDGDLGTMLDLIDGVLLSGGSDLDPARYGDEDVHPRTYGIDALRDRFELQFARTAIERDLPLLCICRGIQVLNVALGGTLYQDIADQIGTEIPHRQSDAGIDAADPSHRVQIDPASQLASIYGTTSVETNSFHHQAVRDVPSSLAAVAHTDDGVIEAIEMPGRSFVFGVQWHPEMMYARHAEQNVLFHALVDAARAAKLVSAKGS